MNSNNIISFPGINKKSNRGPQSIEEITSNMDMIRHVHIGETISVVVPMLFEQLAIAGFDFEEEGEELKYGAFIVESLRSMLMYNYDMLHPFQQIAQELFIPEDDGSLRIKNKLDIELNTQFYDDMIQEEEDTE